MSDMPGLLGNIGAKFAIPDLLSIYLPKRPPGKSGSKNVISVIPRDLFYNTSLRGAGAGAQPEKSPINRLPEGLGHGALWECPVRSLQFSSDLLERKSLRLRTLSAALRSFLNAFPSNRRLFSKKPAATARLPPELHQSAHKITILDIDWWSKTVISIFQRRRGITFGGVTVLNYEARDPCRSRLSRRRAGEPGKKSANAVLIEVGQSSIFALSRRSKAILPDQKIHQKVCGN